MSWFMAVIIWVDGLIACMYSRSGAVPLTCFKSHGLLQASARRLRDGIRDPFGKITKRPLANLMRRRGLGLIQKAGPKVKYDERKRQGGETRNGWTLNPNKRQRQDVLVVKGRRLNVINEPVIPPRSSGEDFEVEETRDRDSEERGGRRL